MADSSRVRGSIAGDCEGEGGGRGKRGHRGPPGPSVFDGPTPPFATDVHIIYARPDGSDKHGKGTRDEPYATFSRAIQAVPIIIPALVRYYVDITGINETLPPDYALPPIKSASYYTVLGADPIDGARRFSNGLVITAAFQPFSGIPLADTTISIADTVSNTVDPVTFQRVIVVNKLYPAGVLRNTLLVSPGPAKRTSTIFDQLDNVPAPGQTTLLLTTTTVNPSFTAPFQIMEQSATLTCQNGDEAFTGLGVKHIDAIQLQGLKLRNSDPGINSYGLCVVDVNVAIVDACDVEGMYIGPNTEYFYFAESVARNKTIESEGQTTLNLQGCCLIDMPTLYTYDVNMIYVGGCGIRNCAAIGPRPSVIFTPAFSTVGAGVATKIQVTQSRIQGSVADSDFGTPGYGVLSIGPLVTVANTQIDGCAADAIYVNGGNAVIQTVTGAGNGGVGVLADKGAQVSVDAATTVQGALVTDGVKAGSLAAVAYAALVPGVAQQYDLPNASNGTGARIFGV